MKNAILSAIILLGACFGLRAQEETIKPAPSAKFEFVETRHNFGAIEEGTQASHDFEFTNVGDEALVITNVRTSCGCTSPFWPREPIQPGETSKITAVYNSKNRAGSFNKTITIESNAVPSLFNLKISGEVTRPKPEETMPFKEPSILSPEGGDN